MAEEDEGLPRAIGRPATGALQHIGIKRLDQVAKMSEAELLRIHGVGPKAVRILKEVLAERGHALRADDPD